MKTFVQNQPKQEQANIATQLIIINKLFKYDIEKMTLSCAYSGDNISTVTGRLIELITSTDKDFPTILSANIYYAFGVAVSYFVLKYIKFEKVEGVNHITGEHYTVHRAITDRVKPFSNRVSSYTNNSHYSVKGNKTQKMYVGKNVERYMELSSEFNPVRCKDYSDETLHYTYLRTFKSHMNTKIKETRTVLLSNFMDMYNATPFGRFFNKTSSVCSSGRDSRNYMRGFFVPYGDTFQKRLTEFVTSYVVTDKDRFYAKKLLLEELYGKIEQDDVNDLWDIDKINHEMQLMDGANQASLIESERFVYGIEYNGNAILHPKVYGLNLYLKELYNVAIAPHGTKSRTMLRFDFVNSGGIHNANSTREIKSMSIANLFGGTRMDSHSILREMYFQITGIQYTRNEIKDLISQGYFHGQSVRALIRNLGVSKEDLELILREVSGDNWDLPASIADFGTEIFMTGVTAIQWKVPDGFTATASSYTTASSVNVNIGSGESISIELVLPLLISGGKVVKGAVRSAVTNAEGETTVKGGKVSIRSFYAILIHSFDAYLLRMLYIKMASLGIKMDSVLDEVGIRGEHVEAMYNAIYDILDDMKPLMEIILNKLSKEHNIPMPDIEFFNNKIVRGFNIMSA